MNLFKGINIFEDRILFIFSDPGGAKPILAFIDDNKLQNYKVISDRVYSFYDDFGVPVHPYKGNVKEEIDIFKPTLIFTGTSYTSTIEKEFISCGKYNHISTLSYVDHWTNISDRFKLQDNFYVFPDRIWVLDERAKKIAIAEGIRENKIFIGENPYLEWLKMWKPQISKYEFLKSIGIKSEPPKIVVYAPDPLSNVNGIEKFGFDEITATQDIINVLGTKNKNILFLCKPHPNQKLDILKPIVEDYMVILEPSVDNNNLIYYADIIIGYFSTFLLEAKTMGKTILRYLPININDPFSDKEIGRVFTKKNISEIINYL